MGKLFSKENLKNGAIKTVSTVTGIGHFTCMLVADGFKEIGAIAVSSIDKNYTKREVRRSRDRFYIRRMAEIQIRIEETQKVMDETYRNMMSRMDTKAPLEPEHPEDFTELQPE